MASTSLERFTAASHVGPPPNLGTRYDRHGRFQPEHGNTVVCHLVEGSPSATAVMAARSRLMAFAPPGKLAFTPVESLHMTLFEGVIHWPEDQAVDADIAGMTELYLQCLEGFEGHGAFKVAVIGMTPTGLKLAGASAQDEAVMRAWRDALTVPFGYRQPQHDDYSFHMTFAYMIDWLAEDEVPVWEAALAAELLTLQRDVPVLELRPPAFCRFADMTHFEELLVLG
jgi:hypothetical protein